MASLEMAPAHLQMELLVGARPRGASLERYCFRFTQVGRHGQESSLRVERV